MVYYDKNKEALFTIGPISYSESKNSSSSVTYHRFSVRVNIKYKINPETSSTQTEKITSKEIAEKYDAKANSKDASERYFKQKIVRDIGGDLVEVSAPEIVLINEMWTGPGESK